MAHALKSCPNPGEKFGRLTFIENAGRWGRRRYFGKFACDCGSEFITRVEFARSGHTKSCGCARLGNGKPNHPAAGDRFGRLTFVSADGNDGRGNYFGRFTCDCGRRSRIRIGVVRSGRTKSCGCLAKEVSATLHRKHGEGHGENVTPEYSVWSGMKARCLCSSGSGWLQYGARGIKVCDRWLSFEAFLADMGRKPTPSHSIDRIDVDGDYEPGNCRWATPREQSHNRRNSKYVELNGDRLPLAIACERTGVPYSRALQRLGNGYSDAAALDPASARRGPRKWNAEMARV